MEISSLGPVLVSTDEHLVAAVVRAAAASGVVPEVVDDDVRLAARWSTAPVVLIGADRIGHALDQALPPRARTYVLCPGAPSRELLQGALGLAAAAVLELPGDEGRLVDLLTDAADGPVAAGSVIGVVGGSGGAGASTFAAAMGLVAARSQGSALLVDADAAGAGADQVLGLRAGGGVRWDALLQVSGRFSARSLREALPVQQGLSVLAWPAERTGPLAPETLRSVLAAARRAYPVVIVDLPRTAPSVLAEAGARCDQVVVVSTVTLTGLAAALHLVKRLPVADGVVLRGRGGVDVVEIERLLGLPVWQRMADQRGLDEAISLGLGPLRSRRGSLARAARGALERLPNGAP